MKKASQAEVTLGQMIATFQEQLSKLHQTLEKTKTEMETLETVIAELVQKRMAMVSDRQRMSDKNKRV